MKIYVNGSLCLIEVRINYIVYYQVRHRNFSFLLKNNSLQNILD